MRVTGTKRLAGSADSADRRRQTLGVPESVPGLGELPGRLLVRTAAAVARAPNRQNQPRSPACNADGWPRPVLAQGSWQWFATYIGVTLLTVTLSYYRLPTCAPGLRSAYVGNLAAYSLVVGLCLAIALGASAH
ncbi:hypothetical protein GCM10009837_38680 [Streptomyces durmitorensis]